VPRRCETKCSDAASRQLHQFNTNGFVDLADVYNVICLFAMKLSYFSLFYIPWWRVPNDIGCLKFHASSANKFTYTAKGTHGSQTTSDLAKSHYNDGTLYDMLFILKQHLAIRAAFVRLLFGSVKVLRSKAASSTERNRCLYATYLEKQQNFARTENKYGRK
jgi:hypothetical protein